MNLFKNKELIEIVGRLEKRITFLERQLTYTSEQDSELNLLMNATYMSYHKSNLNAQDVMIRFDELYKYLNIQRTRETIIGPALKKVTK
jgi:hypothetical protein